MGVLLKSAAFSEKKHPIFVAINTDKKELVRYEIVEKTVRPTHRLSIANTTGSYLELVDEFAEMPWSIVGALVIPRHT